MFLGHHSGPSRRGTVHWKIPVEQCYTQYTVPNGNELMLTIDQAEMALVSDTCAN